jgi:hypothetical protein
MRAALLPRAPVITSTVKNTNSWANYSVECIYVQSLNARTLGLANSRYGAIRGAHAQCRRGAGCTGPLLWSLVVHGGGLCRPLPHCLQVVCQCRRRGWTGPPNSCAGLSAPKHFAAHQPAIDSPCRLVTLAVKRRALLGPELPSVTRAGATGCRLPVCSYVGSRPQYTYVLLHGSTDSHRDCGWS